jgi:hypothetical protein
MSKKSPNSFLKCGRALQVDVVIPTKGEWTLPYCVNAVRKNVDVNNLILVAAGKCYSTVKDFADVCVLFDEKNVGRARALGLRHVETPVYASIDSDVLVTREWFDWCVKTIRDDQVAACQGYAKPLGEYGELQLRYIIDKGGKYGKGFCCLGNTMLKTDVVRKIGMPEIPVEEDWQLRLKVEEAGFKWISNINITCSHLKTDVDVWKHAVWWGKMGGDVSLKRCLARIPYYLTFGLRQRSLKQNLFLVGLQLHLIYGKALGELNANH